MQPWLLQFQLPGIGEVLVSSYFTWLIVGLVLSVEVATREARRSGRSPARFLRVSLLAIAAGLVGGRLGHALFSAPAIYLEDPFRILQFWRGGMVYYGGFLGAIAAIYLWCRRSRRSLLKTADILAPAVPMGLAFGRLGCLSAGCCYGRPIDWGTGYEWPFAVTYLYGHMPEALLGVPLHPVQAYASFGAIALFCALTWVRRNQRFDGQTLAWLLLGYGAIRSILELFRLDLARGFVLEGLIGQNLSTSQALSLPLMAIGGLLLLRGQRESQSPS
ncbi:MAG: prolipoprotein diacylglyceryl transferase [Rickettsiales bacterium]|nr:prolipoprotein diacylglyceryl transferase [Rickettsiales bacterium]